MGKCFVNFQVQCKLQDDCNLFSLMGIITLTMNYEIGFFLIFIYLFTWLLPNQGSNPRLLCWQADSQPLDYQGSP